MIDVPELASSAAWLEASEDRRQRIVVDVADRLGLVPLGIACHGGGSTPIGSLRHAESGVVFRLLPGGRYRMGFSEAECRALQAIQARAAEYEAACDAADEAGDELPDDPDGGFADAEDLELFLSGYRGEADDDSMRPVHEVTLRPFLIASHPLTQGEARHWLPDYRMTCCPHDDDCGPREHHVAIFDEPDLLTLSERWPFQLVSEARWEYAARAGTTTLTFRGDEIDDLVDEDKILFNVADAGANQRDENRFGLHSLWVGGELCADTFAEDYLDAPTDGSPRPGNGPWVVRGGMPIPSQGNEWLMMLSATRHPTDERSGSVRPVLPL